MYKSTVTFVLLSLIVALVNAQCSCQTKPPIDVIYRGEACECGRQYPVRMEVPKITEHRDAHYDYGFTIERPQQPPAEVKYTFDFHMQKPKPLPTASLATYAFEVENPVQKAAEVPQRYSFDYQVQTPVVQNDASTLQGLLAHVDKVVVQKQDCQQKSGCQCGSYKPTIDLLQRCPKHGHLYQCGGALYPNQQRYSKDLPSLQHQTPDQVPTSSDRSKRSIANTFPFKFQTILPGLRSNNQILKVPSVVDEKQNEVSEIIKKNFGEDPRENIEELLRPKPLISARKIESDVEKAQVVKMPISPASVPVKSDFIMNIKPKLEEAKSKFRSHMTKIVNKARLDAIKAKHMIQKRSTESEESEVSDVYMDDGSSYEPIWVTDESVENLDTETKVNDLQNPNEEDKTPVDRIRKHCDRCGELAKKYPCPSCGAYVSEGLQPQNFEMKQRNPIRYVPGQPKQTPQHLSQPRYVHDRSSHRHVGNNEDNQFNDDVQVGSHHSYPNGYGQLQDILSKNSAAMNSQNRGVGQGHLLQPMNFEHASDAIRFIQELTQINNNQHNEDYYSNGNSYDEVGAKSPKNYHAKRSFKIVPLAEKDDGSVFVKILPVGSSETRYDSTVDEVPSRDGKNFSENKPTANFEKFVRNGKKYEILALSPNGSDEGSIASEEDLEILKYIYAVNQKGNAKENASINEESEATNINAQVVT